MCRFIMTHLFILGVIYIDKYKVYKHTTPSNKVYIGITSQTISKRWQNGRGYITNEYFYRAIKKYGWENIKHEILFNNLDKDDACKKEIELIAKYNSTDYHYGYNCSTGGNLGNVKSVDQYTVDGKFIKTFPSIAEAETEYNIDNISACCKGKILSSGGFVWRYKGEEYDKYFKKPIRINMGANINNKLMQYINNEDYLKPIIQYSKKGEFIQRYENVYDSRLLTISKGRALKMQILKCCNKMIKTSFGYIWRFDGDDLDLSNTKIIKPSRRKRIVQYDINGNYIKTWDSILEAQKYYHSQSIASVIIGDRRFAAGYVWRYEGDSFDKYSLQKKKMNIRRKYDDMPVYQYDLNGKLIHIYDTVYDIDKNKFNHGNVIKCLLGEMHYSKGYVFSFTPK